jgi:hypothetical protein
VSVRLSREELAELDDAADLRFDADRARERLYSSTPSRCTTRARSGNWSCSAPSTATR